MGNPCLICFQRKLDSAQTCAVGVPCFFIGFWLPVDELVSLFGGPQCALLKPRQQRCCLPGGACQQRAWGGLVAMAEPRWKARRRYADERAVRLFAQWACCSGAQGANDQHARWSYTQARHYPWAESSKASRARRRAARAHLREQYRCSWNLEPRPAPIIFRIISPQICFFLGSKREVAPRQISASACPQKIGGWGLRLARVLVPKNIFLGETLPTTRRSSSWTANSTGSGWNSQVRLLVAIRWLRLPVAVQWLRLQVALRPLRLLVAPGLHVERDQSKHPFGPPERLGAFISLWWGWRGCFFLGRSWFLDVPSFFHKKGFIPLPI